MVPSFLQVRPQVLSLYVIVTVVVITMAHLPLPTFSRRSPEAPVALAGARARVGSVCPCVLLLPFLCFLSALPHLRCLCDR